MRAMKIDVRKNGVVVLKPRHKVFADTYLTTGNASASARKAGFAESSARITGSKLLQRADVLEYLRVRGEEIAAKESENPEFQLQERVVKELHDMAFANIADFITIDEDGRPQVDFSTATREQLKSITSIVSKRKTMTSRSGDVVTEDEARFGFADKYRGLELLGKHLGMFKEADQRIVVDVADRLMMARQRLKNVTDMEAE